LDHNTSPLYNCQYIQAPVPVKIKYIHSCVNHNVMTRTCIQYWNYNNARIWIDGAG